MQSFALARDTFPATLSETSVRFRSGSDLSIQCDGEGSVLFRPPLDGGGVFRLTPPQAARTALSYPYNVGN